MAISLHWRDKNSTFSSPGHRNLGFQQNIGHTGLSILVLAAKSTHLKDTYPLMEKVAELLPDLVPGTVEVVTP
jgi:hypothetical protein